MILLDISILLAKSWCNYFHGDNTSSILHKKASKPTDNGAANRLTS